MNLTPKQLRILQIVRDWRTRFGYSPTLQEIADEVQVSKVTVFEHVEALIKKGALERDPNKARSLTIPDDAVVPDESRPFRFPLVGRIAAGYPIEKVANQDELDLESFFGPQRGRSGAVFALRVEGDSMQDEGIWDGDYVLIERKDVARNGERVVALLPNGETTLKTFYREKDHIRLQPANDAYEPILVKDCTVQGIVVGVIRYYG
ncbi:MAG: transcriptional repressor LexA [Planctomycetes bacterium]|nr:transcriptional repressor LexA [Planctomycetota bacterium]NOG55032.1 transcriptional repressor LexA [Planctomycetota bacterium]